MKLIFKRDVFLVTITAFIMYWIISFTDGATEAMNDKRKIYGRSRLETLIAESKGTVEETLQQITNEVGEFIADVATRDDLCLIGIRRSE